MSHRIFNSIEGAVDSSGVRYAKIVGPVDIITADGGSLKINGSALAGAELGFIDGAIAGTGVASKALVLSSTLTASISGSGAGAFLTAAPGTTGAGLKIHTHSNVNNSGGTYDYTYMNEFKGEFVSTSGTMVGVGADYTLSGSGTGAMCASSGYAKLLTGITMSGAAMPTAGVLTGGQFFANVAGTVSGAGCAVMGLYGGIDYNTGGTLTTCDYITGIQGEYRSNIDCGTGTSSILRLVKGGTAATAVDYGIYMLASNGTITTGVYLPSATTGINLSGTYTTGIAIEAASSSITFGTGDGKIVDAAASLSIYGGNTGGDDLILYGNSSDTTSLSILGATGLSVLGTVTTGLDISTASATGISINTSTPTRGILISAACTTGIDITGACTRGIRVGTHDWGGASTGLTISTTDPLMQVAGKITASNVTAGVYACSYNQLALKCTTQNTDTSWFADWSELYITGGTLTGSSHYAAVKGHVEVAGTVVSSTGVTASLWGSNIIPAGYTNAGIIAGCYVDGIIHTSMTNTGNTMAFGIGPHSDPNQVHWEYGLYMPAHTCDMGIYQNPATMGIYSEVTTYPAAQWGNSAHHFYVKAAAPRNENGSAGYFQTDVTGTQAGTLYNFGSWINFLSGSVSASGRACAQDNGIYATSDSTMTGSTLVIGMRMECIIEGGANPAALYLFSTSISSNALTAMFDINAKEDIGWITGSLSNASGAGHIPLFTAQSTGGTVHYINTYTS